MFLSSSAPYPDIGDWARGNGLEIIWLLTGAALLTRLATWLGGRITARIDANARETDALVRSEASKHRHALTSVITWVTLVIIYCVTGVQVLRCLEIPLTNLVAPAAVAGVALGFGAQRIVQDLLAGFFIITERQYGYGDLIRLSVTNLSRDWARAVVDVPVPVTADVHRVSDLLRQIGEEAYKDPDLRSLLLDAPAVLGVESLDMDRFQLRMVARTLPGMQFDVGAELRIRIAAGLRREGINLPTALETGEPTGPDGPEGSDGPAGQAGSD